MTFTIHVCGMHDWLNSRDLKCVSFVRYTLNFGVANFILILNICWTVLYLETVLVRGIFGSLLIEWKYFLMVFFNRMKWNLLCGMATMQTIALGKSDEANNLFHFERFDDKIFNGI